jgi:predicted phage-related endonuclease
MDRTLGIGGSDAKRIIDGDWHSLWLEKTKRVEQVDLSDVLPVQIGIATEKLNLDWLERCLEKSHCEHTKIKRDITLEQKDFMMSHLDGLIEESNIVVEAKHTYENNNLENVAQYYYCQMQHYMMHSGANETYLTVFFGNRNHDWTSIESDPEFQKTLYKAEMAFWKYVEEDKEPKDFAPIEQPKEIKLDGMRTLNMKDNQQMNTLITSLKECKPYVAKHKEIVTDIKNLVPDDCRKAIGNGVVISRSKKGTLTLRENANE